MPSRAVVRKKARREAKRTKKASMPPPVPRLPPAAPEAAVERAAHPPAAKVRPAVPVRAPRESTASTASAAPAAPAAPAASVRVAAKRPRELPAPLEPIPEGLSRKERRREVSRRILDKQLARVNASAAAVAAAEAAPEGSAEAQAVEHRDRHDPRFSGGTYWRDRKERRARTLFLGGIPYNMTSDQVKDFINTVIDSDNMAVEYLNQLAEGTDAVEEVDFLPIKHSKVRNTYITLASVAIAGCAASKLDGHKMDGRFLRCNFAADKTQRSIAINRRSTR